ncbi:MAG: elongation factor Ts, partial [Fimbriimonas ginsengisoli]|nr:elongation factor Ts [Fimbriimonas ginsengisoli]
EGKDEKIAKNIAMGRINKEYLKRVVLLEQPFYRDPAISVGQYLKEHGGATIVGFTRLAVGEGG